MINKNYTAEISVVKSPWEVFNYITEVTKWWSNDFEGASRQLNDEFIIHHPNAHYSKQKLIEIIPAQKISWLVTESALHWLQKDKQEWTNRKMIFEINAEGNKTIVHFMHEGLNPKKECYAMCEKGWNIIIKNWLFHLITYDTPSPEMAKAAEIRNQMLAENNQSKP